MALKPDRYIVETEVVYRCNDVHVAGNILCYSTAASGGGLQVEGFVQLAVNPSGLKPAGLSLAKMVNKDQTQVHRNFHNNEQIVGENVPLVRRGYVVTNMVTGTPTVGATAYVTTSGVATPTLSTTGGLVATPPVGEFQSILDEDNYCKLYVKLPA
jgi:hypothetical protein